MSTQYTVIAENDESDWNDSTGEVYHFPKKYLKILSPGTKVVYYTGRMKNKKFAAQRVSIQPHYFGIATIDSVESDVESRKGDKFATIANFQRFENAVPIKDKDRYFEQVPSPIGNFFRNGVRPISELIYQSIISFAKIDLTRQGYVKELETVIYDGNKRRRYTAYYERNSKLRAMALTIHGHACKVCNMSFLKRYGEIGDNFIHVHHLKPLSETGRTIVNPDTDLTVVCPNCHYMLHRPKDKVLSVEELKALLQTRRYLEG